MTTFLWWAAFALSGVLIAAGIWLTVVASQQMGQDRLGRGICVLLTAVVIVCAGVGLLGLTVGHGLVACDQYAKRTDTHGGFC